MNHKGDFEKIKFDSVILDESQFVKNFRTKRYRTIQKINASFLLALTGTPIENNIEELWSLFNLINPGLLGSNAQFMKKYGNVCGNILYTINLLDSVITREAYSLKSSYLQDSLTSSHLNVGGNNCGSEQISRKYSNACKTIELDKRSLSLSIIFW